MHKQILRQIVGVFDKNGFHLHATHILEEMSRGNVSDQQAESLVAGVVDVFRSLTPDQGAALFTPKSAEPVSAEAPPVTA